MVQEVWRECGTYRAILLCFEFVVRLFTSEVGRNRVRYTTSQKLAGDGDIALYISGDAIDLSCQL
jgi:hypothetical protein